MTNEELKNEVDILMAKATQLQDEGRWAEAETVISEAENLEDLHADDAQWDETP